MLAARAWRAASWLVVGPFMWSDHCNIQGHCTSKRLLSFGARPCSDVAATTSNATHVLRLGWHRRHCALSLSVGGAAHACARAGRAARRADRAMHNTRQRRQLEASLLRCTAVFRRASSGLPCQASSASRVAQKPLRSLLLRRWRSTRACRVCAPRCATCDWFMHMFGPLHHARPLHPREASILRCTAVLGCASCGLQRQACAASRVAQAPLPSLSLGRRRSTRARSAARHANRCNALYKATAPARCLFPSMHGRASTCQPLFITSSRLARVRTRD